MTQQIRVGTAPDSWGVWFPSEPHQVPWDRFLDEVVEAGYHWIELGPYGYLPTDPKQLEDELGKRNLKMTAGTVFTGFHKEDESQWQRAWDQALAVATLVSKLGVEHLVVIPDLWRDDKTGQARESRTLSNEQWKRLASGHNKLGKALLEEFGIHQQFHSHADSHIGLHLKQVHPDILAETLKNDIPFGDAVAKGVMTEPGFEGVPKFAPIIERALEINPDIFAIIEQDMYGCPVDMPFPIAQRTREHILAATRAARVK